MVILASQGGREEAQLSYCKELYIGICLDIWFIHFQPLGVERGGLGAGVITEGRHPSEYSYHIPSKPHRGLGASPCSYQSWLNKHCGHGKALQVSI